MKRALTFLLIAGACYAQDGAIERGAQLYRAHCAIPYCHGPGGSAGRAPQLTGHHFNVNSMFKMITWGIPGTERIPVREDAVTVERLKAAGAIVLGKIGRASCRERV